MLSRTAEHALRAAIFLARQDRGRPLSAEAIATGLAAPRNYMGKTLSSLVSHGIVASSPGRKGGFRLAVPAAHLTVAQIIAQTPRVHDRPETQRRRDPSFFRSHGPG